MNELWFNVFIPVPGRSSSSAVSWTKDGSTISSHGGPTSRISFASRSGSSTITISPVVPTDAGRYRWISFMDFDWTPLIAALILPRCVANHLISDAAVVKVAASSAVATPNLRSSASASSSLPRYAKPRITNRPKTTEVTKGETIRLSCGPIGFPTPTFSWFKDGGRLSSAHDRFHVKRKSENVSLCIPHTIHSFQIADDGTLVIENAQLDDAAHYRCSATNYLGRASSAARVRVNLKELLESKSSKY